MIASVEQWIAGYGLPFQAFSEECVFPVAIVEIHLVAAAVPKFNLHRDSWEQVLNFPVVMHDDRSAGGHLDGDRYFAASTWVSQLNPRITAREIRPLEISVAIVVIRMAKHGGFAKRTTSVAQKLDLLVTFGRQSVVKHVTN